MVHLNLRLFYCKTNALVLFIFDYLTLAFLLAKLSMQGAIPQNNNFRTGHNSTNSGRAQCQTSIIAFYVRQCNAQLCGPIFAMVQYIIDKAREGEIMGQGI